MKNETNLGIVPLDALTRRFRDLAGTPYQDLAACRDRLIPTVAALPLTVTGGAA
ncbi:bifunctional adenosylcobinamide kinase/adenosylcobinamide-phosphate guanylyltransferase [Thiocystis violascens]|uniref:bifunctional adenosylcobinamide kinase/adenosylcobinamide-phosphate guanylyltransferase n=1 Tax=Thiocystis violascens TaxID=73141 RepID=UPI00022C2205|nr:bifunctional adenosylcobinamide kinase/adenosylcobinamide-phosphate guanylyltransferase [Thiocystis violascens]